MNGGDRVKVEAWNNGQHRSDGNGFGIDIRIEDRRSLRARMGLRVCAIRQHDQWAKARIDKDSFWDSERGPATCVHLIQKQIGLWLIEQGYRTWQIRKPPSFELTQLPDEEGQHRFQLTHAAVVA